MSIKEETNYPIYPNLKQMWGLFGIFLFVCLGMGFIKIIFGYVFAKMSLPSEVSGWLTFFIYVSTMVSVISYVKSASFSTDFDYGFVTAESPVRLFLILTVGAPAMVVVNDWLVGFIPMPEIIEKSFIDMVQPNFPSFMTVVIAASILEELLCRGIVLKGLLRNMHPVKAILWSALFFAALHLNPWQGIAAFIIGCISGWIFWKTKSVVPCIFLHLLNNGTAFIILIIMSIFKIDPKLSFSEISGTYYTYILVLSFMIFFAVLYILYKKPGIYKK